MSGLKQVAYYGVAVLILKGLGFFMLPVFTRVLNQQEYGYLNFLVTLCAACSVILSFGLPELIFRHKQTYKHELNSLITECVLVSLTGCLVLTLLVCLNIDSLVLLLPVNVDKLDIYLLLVNLCCSALLSIPYSYWRLQNKAKSYCCACVAHGLSQTMLSLFLLFLGLGVTGVMLSGAICSLVILVLALIRVRKSLIFSFATREAVIKRRDFYFMSSIVLSSICLYVGNGAENWFIVANSNTQTLAIYFVAAQFALMTSFAFEPVRMWWFAKRFEKHNNNAALYGYEATRCLNIAIFISLVMLILSEQLLVLMLPDNYAQSATWVPLLIIVVIFRHHADLLNIGCFLVHNAKYVFVINAAAALLMLALMAVLVPKYLMTGAVFSLITVHGLRALAFYITSQMLAPIPYKLSQVIVAWLCLFILILIGYSNTDYVTIKRLLVLSIYGAYLVRLYFHDISKIAKQLATVCGYKYA